MRVFVQINILYLKADSSLSCMYYLKVCLEKSPK